MFRLYQKALNSGNLDDVYTIARSWELFERCYGTYKTLEMFLKKYDVKWADRIDRGEPRKRKESSSVKSNRQSTTGDRSEPVQKKARSSFESNEQKRRSTELKRDKERQGGGDDLSEPTGSKRKMPSEKMDEQVYSRKIAETDDNVCVFLSNLDYNLNEDDIRQGLADVKIVEIDLIRSGNGRSRGFAYAKLENEVITSILFSQSFHSFDYPWTGGSEEGFDVRPEFYC